MIIFQAPPVADMSVAASLSSYWATSRLRGEVLVTGTVTRPASLRIAVADARNRTVASGRVASAADNTIRLRIPLPKRIAAGVLNVTVIEPVVPFGQLPLPTRTVRLRLTGPPEGIVARAELARRGSGMVAVIRFLTPPRRGVPMRLVLRRPDGTLRTVANPSRNRRVMTARIELAEPPTGMWVATLFGDERPAVRFRKDFSAKRG